MDAAIKVENLSKRYQIGKQLKKNLNFQEQLTDLVAGPFKRLKKAMKGEHLSDTEDFWALNDVSFDVQHGEVIGIIGRNGAGKSTLLKILSRITKPTSGRIVINGRVASLLEVGTGFHPELTGRENIYLNGSILGMTRAEINGKFDEIVEFSEIEKFLDTPVKRYSSGMYVRLAFAVAAHLDPEILIVDEVLAVGDVAFQKKCLGKMQDVSKGGRTVLFVSHNMAAIEHLCSRAIWLYQGRIAANGQSHTTIREYLQGMYTATDSQSPYRVNYDLLNKNQNGVISITDVQLLTDVGKLGQCLSTGDALRVRILYKLSRQIVSPAFAVSIKTEIGQEVLRLSTMPISGYAIDQLYESGQVDLLIESLPITGGTYHLDIGVARSNIEWILRLEGVVSFEVQAKDVYKSGCLLDYSRGLVIAKHRWEHQPQR